MRILSIPNDMCIIERINRTEIYFRDQDHEVYLHRQFYDTLTVDENNITRSLKES